MRDLVTFKRDRAHRSIYDVFWGNERIGHVQRFGSSTEWLAFDATDAPIDPGTVYASRGGAGHAVFHDMLNRGSVPVAMTEEGADG